MPTFLYSGHMVDAPGRARPRLPAARVPALAQAITRLLQQVGAGPQHAAVGGAACGADLLFAQALLQRGVALRLYLALPEAEHLQRSVAFAGDDWVQRYHAAAAAATQCQVVPADAVLTPPATDPFERANLWMLAQAQALAQAAEPASGAAGLVFLCVWNGQGGDGPGGTAHMVRTVQAAGGRVHRIDPDTL